MKIYLYWTGLMVLFSRRGNNLRPCLVIGRFFQPCLSGAVSSHSSWVIHYSRWGIGYFNFRTFAA